MCRQAQVGCWCGHLSAQQPSARVVLLQHPREARNPLGTARMAHLALPGSELFVGIDFERDGRLQAILASEGERAAVLFPSPEARPVAELAGRPVPPTLVVIDGTWWQARKIWRSNPSLRALPAYRIEPEQPSTYVIRSEPEAHCLSTIEAVAQALDAIAGERGRHASMLAPLRALVDKQLTHAHAPTRSPRRREHPRPARPPVVPEPLQGEGGLDRALLVYAEGNGWNSDHVPPPQLAHWVATRPATGERFEARVLPDGFGPHAFDHLGMHPHDFEAAMTRAQFAERWASFVRADDVWCAWGFFPAKLLAGVGLTPRFDVDMRGWCHARAHARPGGVEAAAALLGSPADAPAFPGRAGRRLAALEAVFAALAAPCRGG